MSAADFDLCAVIKPSSAEEDAAAAAVLLATGNGTDTATAVCSQVMMMIRGFDKLELCTYSLLLLRSPSSGGGRCHLSKYDYGGRCGSTRVRSGWIYYKFSEPSQSNL